ncbi:MAG: hypothetical protein MZV64_33720 [Ignavibacteriales bacterium]|nr:hypothetical protein [Ignavibacteriales bacterium]
MAEVADEDGPADLEAPADQGFVDLLRRLGPFGPSRGLPWPPRRPGSLSRRRPGRRPGPRRRGRRRPRPSGRGAVGSWSHLNDDRRARIFSLRPPALTVPDDGDNLGAIRRREVRP